MERNQVSQDELDGAAPYTPRLLGVYNLGVLWFNNQFVWRCPSSRLLAQYNEHVAGRRAGGHHLDVGPGTGYFLRYADLPPQAQVTLLDLNPTPLEVTARRLQAKQITAAQLTGSILDPVPSTERFDSVAANLVMHCVPGDMAAKGRLAFAHLAKATADTGVFFGSTVLAEPSTALSRKVGESFRRRKAFFNAADDLEGLEAALDSAWAETTIQVVGQVALWTARKPRRDISG